MSGEGFAAERLRACALFAKVSDPQLEQLARVLRRRRFRRNEVIFHQGDPGDSLHVVAAGAVKIVLPSAEGDEAIIATLRPGDFFGELALLDGAPRSATAIALEPSETLELPAGRLPRPAGPRPEPAGCAPRRAGARAAARSPARSRSSTSSTWPAAWRCA